MNATIIANELYNALHITQETHGTFSDVENAVSELLSFIRRNGGGESKVDLYLQRWLDQKGGTEQERYDRLAAFWCGLEAGRDNLIFLLSLQSKAL